MLVPVLAFSVLFGFLIIPVLNIVVLVWSPLTRPFKTWCVMWLLIICILLLSSCSCNPSFLVSSFMFLLVIAVSSSGRTLVLIFDGC